MRHNEVPTYMQHTLFYNIIPLPPSHNLLPCFLVYYGKHNQNRYKEPETEHKMLKILRDR